MKGTKRKVGGALLLAGTLALGGGLMLDAPVSAQEGNSPEVECGTDVYVMKFDGFDSNGNNPTKVGPQPNAVTLTETGDTATSPKTWSWTSTVPIARIVLKGGSEDGVVTVSPAGTNGVIEWHFPPQISHITFCGPGTNTSSSSSSSSSTTATTIVTTTAGPTTTAAPTTTEATATTVGEGVLPTQLEQTTSTTAAQVAGVQQTRTLPRTGLDSTAILLVVGLALVAGGTCVLRSATASAR